MKQLNIHLVSDHGVDALIGISKEAMSRFKNVQLKEYIWPVINTLKKLEEATLKMQEERSFVLYTITDHLIRKKLKDFCHSANIPCIPVLSRIIREISSYIKEKPSDFTDQEYEVFTDDYFARIDAMNYVLSHDDGQNMWDLQEADIIIVGVSRTSKSPVSVYLSQKAYKVANIPFVMDIPIPQNLIGIKNKLVVGLTIKAERLIEIRRSRLILNQDYDNKIYSDEVKVQSEITQAKRIFMQNNWPMIDVTNRSVEEVAAAIMKEYAKKCSSDKI